MTRLTPRNCATTPSEPDAKPAPLAPHERAAYRAALVQVEAMFALAGLHPSDTDHAINVAVLAGSVAPEQARAELLAYLLEHKTQRGFIESRAWRQP